MKITKADITNLSLSDFQKYFLNTFLKLKVPKKESWEYFYIKDVQRDQGSAYLKLVDQDDNRYNYYSYQLDYDLFFPETGYYKYKNQTIYYELNPKRQWKKGLSIEFIHIHFVETLLLSANLLRPFGKNPRSMPYHFLWTPQNLNSIFLNPSVYDETDFSFLCKKMIFSCFVNREFCITLGAKAKLLDLWYKGLKVGNILKDREILVTTPEFEQEIRDTFIEKNFNVQTI